MVEHMKRWESLQAQGKGEEWIKVGRNEVYAEKVKGS